MKRKDTFLRKPHSLLRLSVLREILGDSITLASRIGVILTAFFKPFIKKYLSEGKSFEDFVCDLFNYPKRPILVFKVKEAFRYKNFYFRQGLVFEALALLDDPTKFHIEFPLKKGGTKDFVVTRDVFQDVFWKNSTLLAKRFKSLLYSKVKH